MAFSWKPFSDDSFISPCNHVDSYLRYPTPYFLLPIILCMYVTNMDFDSQALFGDQPVPLASKSQREFKANDPAAVRTYIETKFTELEKHNLHERVTSLENLRIADPSFVERLDRDMTRAAIIATKKVKKTRRFPWSPTLAKAWAVLHALSRG